ncbi:antitoxin Xre/MbcA/ParS toxin-binding domain-containing protein [Castellaniella sp. MT123]|uniref:antitoxin Xre/MbcA/ParS toxin-binding domain-containing protein n=1 Tax=Castellaniella sp. MT123 TaxID=3140381 RepID=UPI0031F384AC
MIPSTLQNSTQPDPSQVLSKAVVRAANHLAMPQATLAKVLGLSAATVSRLCKGGYTLDASRKEWEFALLLIRVYRSLDSIVGNALAARQWLQSENRALNGRPIDLIHHTEGLVRVVQYLDASRAVI